eukprot:2947950-Pyramimonas_sp.AAC.1
MDSMDQRRWQDHFEVLIRHIWPLFRPNPPQNKDHNSNQHRRQGHSEVAMAAIRPYVLDPNPLDTHG